jgi:hypothetical protein
MSFFGEEGRLQTTTARRLMGDKMGWIFGIIYFVLLVTLGIVSLRKGHWIMFIIGLFIPLFWFIGALVPPVARRQTGRI